MIVRNIIKRKCFLDIESDCFIKNGIHKKMIKSKLLTYLQMEIHLTHIFYLLERILKIMEQSKLMFFYLLKTHSFFIWLVAYLKLRYQL